MNSGHCVRLVLPDTNDGVITKVLDRITERWSGCTHWYGWGTWQPDGDGSRVRERIVIVECSVGRWTNRVRKWWHDLAAEAAKLSDQECVFSSVRSERALLANRDGTIRYIGVE